MFLCCFEYFLFFYCFLYSLFFLLIRDRPFNLKVGGGGVMVFCFVQNFFFGQHKSQNIYFFCRAFFPHYNIRLYDKNSESDYFFPLHQNQNIFFSNIGNQNIFLEKNHTPPPPFKLNGRSLSVLIFLVTHGKCDFLPTFWVGMFFSTDVIV